MTINKQIKNTIDELEVGDDLICKYTVEQIDDDGLYTLSENDTFKQVLMYEDEIFDMLYEDSMETEANS